MRVVEFIAGFLRSNSLSVAVAIVATTLAVFGVYLLRVLKSVTKTMNFLIRFMIYVLVYAFGIGFLSALAVKFIAGRLGGLNSLHLVLAVGLVFLVLCLSAKIQKQI
jgi:K+ transporter